MTESAFNRCALSLPGPWMHHQDRNWAGDLLLVLSSAVDQFNEAVVAFDLFEPPTAQRGAASAEQLLESKRRSIYAKAFVYALDAARAFVYIVAADPMLSSASIAACAKFSSQFGYIRDIRNSLQHIEERTQGKGTSGKRILGPVISLGLLMERRFCVTSGSGQHLEIEISEAFVRGFREALSDVLWSFEWLGPGQVHVQRGAENA